MTICLRAITAHWRVKYRKRSDTNYPQTIAAREKVYLTELNGPLTSGRAISGDLNLKPRILDDELAANATMGA
jgi:hypothetical protein